MLLEVLQKLDPRNDVVKTKLADLNHRILDASEFEVNLDLGKSWQPRPFTVGSRYEKPADRDGVLFLRVNVPRGAKCTGRLTALVSGATKP